MKTAIRYFTKSKKGNTKKLAAAVSRALEIKALDVSVDLPERIDKLILINAMYAANVDKAVLDFLSRNKDKIGEIYNMNTSASGKSTHAVIKKAAEPLGISVSDKEFHCAASWIFINKGLPSDKDLEEAAAFALSAAK